jgi:PAS domain S-box-containing protein
MSTLTVDQLLQENEDLRCRLEEAENIVRALRAGEADAILVEADRGRIFTLEAIHKPYRLLVEQMPQAAATLKVDGEIIYCNRGFADLLQCPLNSLPGKPITSFVSADERPRLEALLCGGNGEISLCRADGTQTLVFFSISRVQEGALGTCLILTDLTEHRRYEELERAQQALRESEERLASDLAAARRLQEISTLLIQEGDVGQLYHRILDAAMAIMRSDFATMQMFDEASGCLQLLAYRGFGDEFAASFRHVPVDATTTCGIAWRSSRRVIAPNLETFSGIAGTPSCEAHLEAGVRAAQSTPLLSRSGVMLGMISTHWRAPYEPDARDLGVLDVLARQAADLIEGKHAEQALRSSEARLRIILDNAPAMVYVVDREHRFMFINRRWKKVFNLTNEQVAGRSFYDFFPKQVADDFATNNCKVLEANTALELEEVVPQADGEHTYISSKVPLFDASGVSYAVCGISVDITERKRAVQVLRDADRRKDEFLATLAHELRNPLAPIRNAVKILQAKGPPTQELVWARGVIDRQLQFMSRLLEDLLDVSRISRNSLQLRMERIDLAAAIEAAVETSRPVIDAGQHELTVVLPLEPVCLEADLVRLAEIFANLLNNAAKYTEAGGRISLAAKRCGSEVVVSVKDNGIGINADMLPRVFEIFTQSKGSLERSQGGLGIGLSLVKGLVELHGGSIECRSDGAGRGSEFIVRLPVASESPIPAKAGMREDDGQNSAGKKSVVKRRVLIADDNRDAADSLSMLLKLSGHEVKTGYDGEQALEVAEAMRPEVVLLDIGMPKLNGYEVCRRIRKEAWGKDILLIALTGWGQEEDRRRTDEAGFNEHMVKPVDPTQLVQLLTALA